ncbi:MAG: LysM domain-containing protein [Sandaracinus sp.]
MKRLLAAWIAVLALSSVAAAQEARLEDYVVQEGDSCATIAERWYGSPRRYDRIHEHNPELGPMPHHLHAGQVLHLPLPREQGADATLTDARGEVRAQQPHEPAMSTARVGAGLTSGARLGTGERSSAELTFRSSSVAAIREQTLVIVHGASVEHVREEGTHAEVREGSILSRLSSLSGGAPLVVTTPSAEVRLEEGEASLDVSPSGDTAVSAHAGRSVNVTAAQQSVSVASGQGTVVRRGRPPPPPRPLPAAPEWASGEARTFLGPSATGGTVRGSWLPVATAAAYRVEIARREDGRDLVFQAEVPSSVTRFEAYHLPAGVYFARIATLDADRLEGRPTTSARFEVVGVRFVAPGEAVPEPGHEPVDVLEELDALADATLFATSAPPPPEVLRGSRVLVPDGVVCAMGVSEPSHELVLEATGTGFLTCVDGAGATIEGIDVSVVGIRAELRAADGSELGALERGSVVPVLVRLGAGAPDESAVLLRGSPGIAVSALAPHGESELAATLTVSESASATESLAVAARTEPEIALVTIEVATEAPPPPPPPPPVVVRPFRLHEAFGALPNESWVGLRDEQRTGVGGTIGVMAASARLGEPDARLRFVAAASAGLFDDFLRIGAAVPLDAVGQRARSADRGARDLFLTIGSRLLSAEQTGGFGLALEAGVWAPTAMHDGLDRARFQFAADLSLRIGGVVALRTRQAGILDAAAPSSTLYASAYGVDVRLADPLTLGVEGTMTIGREDGRDWYAGGAALALGLDLAPVYLSLAGRYGWGDDLWPLATLAFNARVAFDP